MKVSILEKLFGKKKKNLICQKCGKEIITPAFIFVKGEIIANSKTPNIFLCPEQKWNYCQGIIMHDTCWMEVLREYGTELYNLEDVRKKLNENKT